MTEYVLGVDPGWRNMGVCISDTSGNVVWSASINPSAFGFSKAVDEIPLDTYKPKVVVIERYVAYSGVQSKFSEHILMLIGAIVDRTRSSAQLFFRAIDWKMALVKRAAKEGFENPSTKLDKKFSIALALHLTGKKFKTDHEADAACLAYIGTIKNEQLKQSSFE